MCKVDLKGTYCLDIDGEEFYYGSVCAFKNHGITPDEQKGMKATFTKAQKNAKLIEMHITPLRNELQTKLAENLKADIYFNGDEIQFKLQKAIAQLPEKQQLVFKMKYFEALKYEEISEILTTSVGALKASYHLAVKKIEHFLKTD